MVVTLRLTVSQVEEDFEWVTDNLVQIANSCCGGRVVSALEGGYQLGGEFSSAFAKSVKAHVSCLARGGVRHGAQYSADFSSRESSAELAVSSEFQIYICVMVSWCCSVYCEAPDATRRRVEQARNCQTGRFARRRVEDCSGEQQRFHNGGPCTKFGVSGLGRAIVFQEKEKTSGTHIVVTYSNRFDLHFTGGLLGTGQGDARCHQTCGLSSRICQTSISMEVVRVNLETNLSNVNSCNCLANTQITSCKCIQ